LPTAGWSVEICTIAVLMTAKFFFPDLTFSLGSLPQFDIIGNALMSYYIAVPVNLAEIGVVVYFSRIKKSVSG
ncbi:MAG: hypothetical protein ACXWFI_03240, partial [Methylobacter sp.]